MAEEKKRFSFDDENTIEIKKEELQQKPEVKPEPEITEDKKFSFEDEKIEKDSMDSIIDEEPEVNESFDGDESMPKQKKKFKLKKWQIALLALVAIFIVFIIYIFVATRESGPVYGNRCASLLTLDNSKFAEVEKTIEQQEAINDVKIEVDCRIIKITIDYVDNTPAATAEELAATALHTLDDAMGATKEEGSTYSQLFGKANGKGQYNAEFYLKSNGDSDFPIFGTKHPSSDEISFTGANPSDQETTDKVLEAKQEKENNAQ